MADLKRHLVVAFLKFLEDEAASPTTAGDEDARESLEVARQCLETAFNVSSEDQKDRTKYPLPASLLEIFEAGLEAKKQKKLTSEASPADKEAADKLKSEGNDFMKQDKIQEAIECYTRAIELDSFNAVYFCNRAAAYNKMSFFEKALEDCEHALEIDPKYSKAYNRKGVAQLSLQMPQESVESFQKALELDPQNESYKTSLEQAKKRNVEAEQPTGPGGPGGLNMAGMDFSGFLNNPGFMNMAANMMSSPQMQQMMSGILGNQAGGAEGEGAGAPGLAGLLQAGQQLAQQVQQSNPELVDRLRQQQTRPTDDPDNPPPGDEGGSS